MNRDQLLKIQAYLDQELADRESKEVSDWLGRDPEAKALYEELRSTRNVLVEHPIEHKLPESRSFYWSKIEREITRITPHYFEPGWWLRLRRPWPRLAASMAGVAVLVAVALLLTRQEPEPPQVASHFSEIETPVQESIDISFYSEESGMTVVWVDAIADFGE